MEGKKGKRKKVSEKKGKGSTIQISYYWTLSFIFFFFHTLRLILKHKTHTKDNVGNDDVGQTRNDKKKKKKKTRNTTTTQ